MITSKMSITAGRDTKSMEMDAVIRMNELAGEFLTGFDQAIRPAPC
jgi:hypothetical protein